MNPVHEHRTTIKALLCKVVNVTSEAKHLFEKETAVYHNSALPDQKDFPMHVCRSAVLAVEENSKHGSALLFVRGGTTTLQRLLGHGVMPSNFAQVHRRLVEQSGDLVEQCDHFVGLHLVEQVGHLVQQCGHLVQLHLVHNLMAHQNSCRPCSFSINMHTAYTKSCPHTCSRSAFFKQHNSVTPQLLICTVLHGRTCHCRPTQLQSA